MATNKCFHVLASDGSTYGVAAWTKTEARLFTAARLKADGQNASPTTVEHVGSWDAEYGTVLCYTGPTGDGA